ncbi:dTDP-4-amino-4,6-dideoxygalactose transaminase [bacterium]|nr:dTDP-4-amino-4,6-dideoxygalactose transaminase [bacterium]
MEVPFNQPLRLGDEQDCVSRAIRSGKFSGNGNFTQACRAALQGKLACAEAVLTPSCTAALEMCALLCDVGPGDEVILPAYTFVTTASAFALRGATLVWCDIRPDTKNIDESLIEPLVTDRTKAVVVVHYAGVACEMDSITALCARRGLVLVEDAAQAIDSAYKGKPLGSLGDLAAFSFHETKNVQCGEGGALIVNDPDLVQRAQFTRDKGTNRSLFARGLVDKYTWVTLGSSFLLSELQAAFLLPQLEQLEAVTARRVAHWDAYRERLAEFMPPDALPFVPAHCRHNGHMFTILLDDAAERDAMTARLRERGIGARFHYAPLHRAPYWQGRYAHITLPVTEDISTRLLRLPMHYSLAREQVEAVCEAVRTFKAW